MAANSDSRLNTVHEHARASFSAGSPAEEDNTWVSFRHCLKAMRSLQAAVWVLQQVGFTQAELRAVYPVMLHVEALVYRGDLEFEESQRQGSISSNTAWKSGIEEILQCYGLDLREELSALHRFFLDESRVILAGDDVTRSMIVDALGSRSSDLRLIVRLAYGLTGKPGCDGFIRSVRPFLALGEILDDLMSYEKDVEEDTFNTFRLFAKVYGTEQAPQELDKLMRSFIRRCIDEMPRMDKRVFVSHYRLIEHWFARVGAYDGNREMPKVYASRLFQALPQNVQVNLATRRFEQVSDNVGAMIPKLIEEPRRSEDSNPVVPAADAQLDRSDA